MKTVLVLTENFPPMHGGSGRWFDELYSRLGDCKVIILADDKVDTQAFDKDYKLTIVRANLRSYEWGFKSLTGIKFYWNAVKALHKVVKQYKVDEIHCGRVIHEGVTAWLHKLIWKTPFICYVHGEDIKTVAMSKEHSLMVKQVCKSANYLVCNSVNSAELVEQLGFAEAQKNKVLHPGVDAERFIPVAEDLAFKTDKGWQDRFVIITVGRLQKRKGHDIMIKALPSIKQQHPNVLYVVIGDGEEKQYLEGLVDQFSLESDVQFLTGLNDLEMIKCYQQCDLFILPNRTIENDIEGFGMVLLEAQACGKPVIAGDSGGTKETMLIGETGWVLDCTEAQKLANSMIPIIENKDRLQEMGAKGREHVLKELEWNVHAQKAKQIFFGN
ncbi:glycosyltransferase family 4 protein [Glaciecola sp. 1036]|uniref:glycosyltransferase family 4 protein n=1 Tax=Alteromonadaceae TaxID=72275 RepID=UPI003CFD41F5